MNRKPLVAFVLGFILAFPVFLGSVNPVLDRSDIVLAKFVELRQGNSLEYEWPTSGNAISFTFIQHVNRKPAEGRRWGWIQRAKRDLHE